LTISYAQRLSVPDDVLIRQIEGESVLLNLANERYYGLDAIGTRMWEVLTDSATIQAAFDALLAEFEVDAQTLRTDLSDLIQTLIDNGLVTLEA
jgi:Coenzyme PQQ synthesis protein D (PqqD)